MRLGRRLGRYEKAAKHYLLAVVALTATISWLSRRAGWFYIALMAVQILPETLASSAAAPAQAWRICSCWAGASALNVAWICCDELAVLWLLSAKKPLPWAPSPPIAACAEVPPEAVVVVLALLVPVAVPVAAVPDAVPLAELLPELAPTATPPCRRSRRHWRWCRRQWRRR